MSDRTDEENLLEKFGGRRSFLKRTAATGTASIGLSTAVGSVSADDVVVEPVEGRDSMQLVSSALRDRRTRGVLRTGTDGRGIAPNVRDAQVYRTETLSSTWNTVVVPFTSRDGDELFVFWSDNDAYETQVSLVRVSGTRAAREWTVTETLPDGSTYTRENTTVAELTGTDRDDVSTQILGCDNPNWGCILSTAGAYAGVVGACGACAGSSGWLIPACASCIGTILGSAGLTISCDYCKD
jgi:hypothetical protein